MRDLMDFLASIGAVYEPLGDRLNINNRRFVVGTEVAARITERRRMVYAGKLLGRTKAEFIPSSSLLHELSKMDEPNKVWVNEKAGWLFVCGRDIFEESITKVKGDSDPDACFLVMMGNNCLGYGRMETKDGKRILRNIFDIGDFLRRERRIIE